MTGLKNLQLKEIAASKPKILTITPTGCGIGISGSWRRFEATRGVDVTLVGA